MLRFPTRSARLAFAGLILATLVLASGCSSSSPSSDAASEPSLEVEEAFGALLQASDEYEGGAQAAAQQGGPVGLADFAITNGDLIINAATALQDALAADPSASGFPEPDLVARAATAAASYGRSLSQLSSRLAACTRGDNVCYEAAYDEDTTGSAARADFRNAVQEIGQVAR